MIFVQAKRDVQTGEWLSVMMGDAPITEGSGFEHEGDVETVCIGVLKRPMRPLELLDRLRSNEPLDVWSCPTTLPRMKQKLAAEGVKAIPSPVRAWLTAILPDAQVRELGIGQNVPLSALLCAERLRQRRDPCGGQRIEQLERVVQEQSDLRSMIALKRRLAKAEQSK